MNAQELQSLRNLGNECEEAADEIERLRHAVQYLTAENTDLRAELDAARKVADEWMDERNSLRGQCGVMMIDGYNKGTAAERERCVAWFEEPEQNRWLTPEECAAAIRSTK